MGDGTVARAQARPSRAGLREAGCGVLDLWWWRLRLGGDLGDLGASELEALRGHALRLPPALRDRVVCAGHHLLGGSCIACTWGMGSATGEELPGLTHARDGGCSQ